MIIPALSINMNIPKNYDKIKEQLLLFGLAPTGNIDIDKARLINEIEGKQEENRKAKEISNEVNQNRLLEEQRTGAQLLGVQNRIFFGL